MKDITCQYHGCHRTFFTDKLKSAKFCPLHRAAAERATRRRGNGFSDDPSIDGRQTSGRFGSGVNWVQVLECPKDDPNDDLPPFTTGIHGAKFPMDQFTSWLMTRTVPVGMHIRLTLVRYRLYDDGRPSERVTKQFVFTVPSERQQVKLSDKIVLEAREFWNGFRR